MFILYFRPFQSLKRNKFNKANSPLGELDFIIKT